MTPYQGSKPSPMTSLKGGCSGFGRRSSGGGKTGAGNTRLHNLVLQTKLCLSVIVSSVHEVLPPFGDERRSNALSKDK